MPAPPRARWPSEVWRLVAFQWGALGVVALAIGLGAVPVWGAWLPALALTVATAVYVWVASPDRALRDREVLKALALGAGVRAGGLASGVTLALNVLRPDLWDPGFAPALAIASLVGGAVTLVVTLLSLIGLDAGRTSPAEDSRAS